jgi:hypothetical protein
VAGSIGGKGSKKPEYTVLFLPSVQKRLSKLPKPVATFIEDKLLVLEQELARQVLKS